MSNNARDLAMEALADAKSYAERGGDYCFKQAQILAEIGDAYARIWVADVASGVRSPVRMPAATPKPPTAWPKS